MDRFVVATLLAGAVLAPALAGADVSVNINIGPPPPIAIVAPPPLVVVPGVPAVQYVPSLHVDLFFAEGRWYYWHGGHWFVGPAYSGPWTSVVVHKVPRLILTVPVKYYKVPPGHLKKVPGGPPGHAKGKAKRDD